MMYKISEITGVTRNYNTENDAMEYQRMKFIIENKIFSIIIFKFDLKQKRLIVIFYIVYLANYFKPYHHNIQQLLSKHSKLLLLC